MLVDDLLVVLFCLLFLTERFKEFPKMLWGVRVQSRQDRGEKWVAKEICLDSVGGVAPILSYGGRTAQRKKKQHRDYDATKGFQGEDLSQY